MAMALPKTLLEQFNPYLSFHPHEAHRCITIEDFAAASVLRSHTDPGFLKTPVTPATLSELRDHPELYLDSKTPAATPNPDQDVAYGVQVSENLLVYFYLYYQTDVYDCCGCIPCYCCFKKWAHLGDVKFVAVELMPEAKEDVNPPRRQLKRVYFGAHGSQAGEWVNAADCVMADGSHPVAFPALGDHSHYKKEGLFCRIWGLVWDRTSRNRLVRPVLIPMPATVTTPGFDPASSHWVFFRGHFSADGIDFPAHQGFYSGKLPEVSNNWFRRCFCPDYW